MYDPVGMDKVDGETDLSDDVAGLILVHTISSCDKLGERIGEQLHDAKYIIFIFD